MSKEKVIRAEERETLERKILQAVEDFEASSGLEVSFIRLTKDSTPGFMPSDTHNLTIETE